MNGMPKADIAPEPRADAVTDFARSALFERTFQDGMALVEDTAAYLDGAGRQEARLLDRRAALAYANASMRLTTQLMQVASWLLVQRAVREGDMAAAEACDDRYRLSAPVAETLVADLEDEGDDQDAPRLPDGLMDLLHRSRQLYERVSHLDRRMYREVGGEQDANPVTAQLQRLRAAFGG
jgi:regulator of CtrA degradation